MSGEVMDLTIGDVKSARRHLNTLKHIGFDYAHTLADNDASASTPLDVEEIRTDTRRAVALITVILDEVEKALQPKQLEPEDKYAQLPPFVLNHQFMHADLAATYSGQRTDTPCSAAQANVITSVDRRYSSKNKDKQLHRPLLDIDMDAALLPSSTPGKFHLYLNSLLTHETYMSMLVALGNAGILEQGYVGASLDRGYSALRVPWVKKGQ